MAVAVAPGEDRMAQDWIRAWIRNDGDGRYVVAFIVVYAEGWMHYSPLGRSVPGGGEGVRRHD